MRSLPWLGLLLACSAASTAPPPSDGGADAASPPPLTASITWTDGCVMDRCIPANHIIRSDGPPLSRMTILRCSLSAGVLTLEAATLTQEGQSFEESREAIRLSGTLAREGGPMPWLPLLTNGTLRLRGNGWQAQGPVSGGACRVTATVDERLRRVSGDIRCDGLLDDATPPNSRTVEGRFDVFGCER